MLNAIRITIGVIMALIALGGLWFSFLFMGFAFWRYFTSLAAILDFIFIIAAPFASAYLLLLPRNQKYALVGLAIAILYLGYIAVDQIL